MKVSLLLNAHNEGPEVLRTIGSFRAAAGDCDLEVIVLADSTTDGSCENLPDDVLVLSSLEQLGCGKAKDVLTKHATGDVMWHNDAHNRLVHGTVEEVAALCVASSPCIVSPRLAPLRCGNQDGCKVYGDIKRCNINCENYADAEYELASGGGQFGGDIIADPGRGGEVKVDARGRPPDDAISNVGAVNFSTFAYTRETLEALGGWNRYPGWWGSQELGVSLRAFFASVPIILMRDVVVLHRFRSWNRPDGSAILDPKAPEYYNTPRGHRTANSMYALRVVLDDETWQAAWLPWYQRKNDAEAMKVFAGSEVEQQREAFQALKKRTDREFYTEVLHHPHPLDWTLKEGASRALYYLRAGLGDIVMSIPAQKALAKLSGQPIDIYDKGFHQGAEMREFLEGQPWVRKVIGDEPDLTYYSLVAAEYWAKMPGFFPLGARIGEPLRQWRQSHEVEGNMAAIRSLGYDGPIPSVTIDHMEIPDNFPADYVVIGIGGRSHDRKAYPHWEAVSRTLKDQGVEIVFIGVASDDQPWMDGLGKNMCGMTNLLQLAGVLWRAQLYVGIDNGPSHLAAAVRTPSVLLYGPTAERKNQPWGPCKVLRADSYDCAPCYEHPKQNKCWCCDGKGKAHDAGPCMYALESGYVVGEVLKSLNAEPWHGQGVGQRFYSVKQKLVNRGAWLGQHYGEMRRLCEFLSTKQVNRVLEIGSWALSWPYVLGETLARPIHFICIEPEPRKGWKENMMALRAAGHTIELVREWSGKAMPEVSRISNEWADASPYPAGGFDVLHIDGDHSIEVATRDWDMYRHVVRSGGYVVIHDVQGHDSHGRMAYGPDALFEVLATRYESWRWCDGHSGMKNSQGGPIQGGGIGVIRLPGSDGTHSGL